MFAVEYRNVPLIELILKDEKRNVNVADNDGTTALLLALQQTLDVNPPPPFVEEGEEPPEYIIEDDTKEVHICELLLKAGADANSVNRKKKSCFLIVCERSHKALLHMLLNFDAVPDPVALELLDTSASKDIHDRLHAEEKRKEVEAARQEKEKLALIEDGLDIGGKLFCFEHNSL